MVEKPLYTAESLLRLVALGEGQFLELKGLWSYAGPTPRLLGKTQVSKTVAEYVAAFANADGGTLVLGIEDDGTPTGHEFSAHDLESFIAVSTRRLRSPLSCDHQLLEVDGNEVLVIEVARSPRAVMVDGDGYPYRIGDRVVAESEEVINGLKREYLERGIEQRLADAAVEDLDLSLLPNGADEPGWLAARGLVLPRGGSPAVKRAAVLLAGRPPMVRWHPACSVRVFSVDGTEIRHGADRNVTQVARLDLPIAELIPAAYEAARAQIRRSEKLHDLFFREIPEYPTFAWQEAIVNAVSHRDYADQGRGVEIWFFDDRMEILSPGPTVAPVTVEALRAGERTHASRNPLIARVLVELGLMREAGEGIPRMFDEMQRSFLLAPELDITADQRFVVRLRNTPVFETADDGWRHLVERLTTSDEHARVLLAHPSGFTNEQYREINAVDRDEAYRQIQEMVNAGIVQPADRAGRGAMYHLSAELLEAGSWFTRRIPEVQRFLSENGRLTNADYRQIFDVTRWVALGELRRLVAERLLVLVGERRGAHYVAGPAMDAGRAPEAADEQP